MNKISLLLIVALFTHCASPTPAPKAENGTDAAREFIRAALDGDYDKAAIYMVKDSINDQLLKQQDENYKGLKMIDQNNFKNASIRPTAIRKENDSVIYFSYYHSAHTTDTTTLRVLLKNGKWLVDLKSVIKM